jgi:hypothetical protein
VFGQAVTGGVGAQGLGVDAGEVILFVIKIGGGASVLVVDLGEAISIIIKIMALLDDPFLGFDALVDALDVAEPVFAVKSVLDAVLTLGLGGDLVAVVDVVFQQGLAFVVDVAQAEGDVELFKLAATAVVPVVTFYPAGAVEVVCVVEEAADVDAHYRHVWARSLGLMADAVQLQAVVIAHQAVVAVAVLAAVGADVRVGVAFAGEQAAGEVVKVGAADVVEGGDQLAVVGVAEAVVDGGFGPVTVLVGFAEQCAERVAFEVGADVAFGQAGEIAKAVVKILGGAAIDGGFGF